MLKFVLILLLFFALNISIFAENKINLEYYKEILLDKDTIFKFKDKIEDISKENKYWTVKTVQNKTNDKDDSEFIAEFIVEKKKAAIFRFDNKYRKTYEAYYDENQKMKKDNFGVAALKYGYDNKNHLTEVIHVDENGNKKNNAYGVAIYKYEYDENGNKSFIHFLNSDEKPFKCSDGYYSLKVQYSDPKKLKEIIYLDQFKKPFPNKDGFVRIVYDYDKDNRLTYEATYGEDGKLKVNKDGYAVIKRQYDNLGNKIVESTYDQTEHLVNDNRGIATYKYQYNKQCLTEESFFDKNDSPVAPVGQIAKLTYEYNENNVLTKKSYYNSKGKLTLDDNGIAIYKYSYFPNSNNLHVQIGIDADNKVKHEITYSDKAKIKTMIYYDVKYSDAEELITIKSEYDASGKLEQDEFFLIDCKTKKEFFGIQKCLYKYDSEGKLSLYKPLDSNGKGKEKKIASTLKEYAETVYTYDDAKSNNKLKEFFSEKSLNPAIWEQITFFYYKWIYLSETRLDEFTKIVNELKDKKEKNEKKEKK